MRNRLGTIPACDRRTDILPRHIRAMHMRRAVKIAQYCRHTVHDLVPTSVSWFLPRDAMQARPMLSCGVCLLCPSRSVKTNKLIFKIFSPSGSHTILVFPYRTAWQYSDGNPPNGGVECIGGMQKSRWANIWPHCVLWSVPAAGGSYTLSMQYRPRRVIHIVAGERPSLLIAGNNDKCITRSLEQRYLRRRQRYAVVNLKPK